MKKLKKLICIAMIFALVVSVMPMNALAADDTTNKVKVTLSAGAFKADGLNFNQEKLNEPPASSGLDITVADDAAADRIANANKFNEMFVEYDSKDKKYQGLDDTLKVGIKGGSGTEKDPYIIDQGQTFYLAVDMNLTTANKDANGIVDRGLAVGSGINIMYPGGAFEAVKSTVQSGTENNTWKVSSKYTNPIVSKGTAIFKYYEANDATDEVLNYYPGATGFDLSVTENRNIKAEGQPTLGNLNIIAETGTGYIPSTATWDTVIKLKATGKGPVQIYANASKNFDDSYDGNSAKGSSFTISDGYGDSLGEAKAQLNQITPTNVSFHPTDGIWFEIKSKDPEGSVSPAKIEHGADQDVTVTLANCNFKASGVSETSFKVTSDAEGTVAVNSIVTAYAPGTENTKATLTLDASTLTENTKYYLWIDKEAVEGYTAGAIGDAVTHIPGGSFTVMPNIGGTVKLQKGGTDVTTGTYGDELTADVSGLIAPSGGTGVTYQWQRADSATGDWTDISVTTGTGETAKTEKATKSTYTLDKADVGKFVRVVVKHPDHGGSVDATLASAVGKKEVGLPSAFTDVTKVSKGTGPKTVTGEKAVTGLTGDTVVGVYSFTYSDISDVGSVTGPATFTSIKAPMDAYYKLPASAAVPGCTGEVTDKGYNLTATASGVRTGSLTLKVDNAAYTSYPGGAAKEITVDLQPYEDIDGDPTTTVSGVTLKRTGRNTFTIEADEADEAIATAIAIKVKNYVKTLTADDITIDHTKAYDNTDTATSITAVVKDGSKISGKTGVTLTVEGKYTTVTAGSKEIEITAIDFGASDADKAYYALGDDLAVGETFTMAAKAVDGSTDNGITKAPLGNSTVTVDYTTSGEPDVAGLVEALKKADVIPGANMPSIGTVSELLDSSKDVEQAVEDWVKTQNDLKNTEPESDVLTYPVAGGTVSATAPAAVTLGDTIKPDTTPEAGTTFALTNDPAITGYSIDPATGVITIGTDATKDTPAALTVEMTKADGTKTTVTVNVTPADAVYGYDIKNWPTGKELTFDIKDLLDTTKTLTNFTLPTTGAGGAAEWPTVNAKMTYTKQSTPAPSGILVTYDTKGYGKSELESDNADGDGKLASVPGVDTVKGAYFGGWTLKPGNAQTMYDPENPDAKAFEEDTTLYALINGYLSGDGAGHAMPAKNITKQEMATMLVIASSDYDVKADYGTPSFGDVGSNWATKFIARAEELGFIDGHDGVFEPTKNITRNEAARMIADAFGVEIDPTETTDVVSDFDEVPTWAKKYVAALCNRGVIKGKGDGKWHGNENIRRDEAAVMINVFLGMTDEKAETIKNDNTLNYKFTDIKAGEWNYAPVIFASLAAPAELYSYEYTMPEKLADKTPETEETTTGEEVTPAE